MQSFPLRVLLCSVFDTFERSALRKQLNLELIFSSYRNWVPGRWHWEPAWVPINIMLLFYSHHSEIRSTSTRMVSIWKTSRSWYRCKETINSQLHFLPRIVGAHTPRWGTINLDLSVFDIFVRLYLSRSSHIHCTSASIIMNRRNAGTVLNLWSVGVTDCCGCLFSTRDVWSASSKVLLQEINAWEESWKLRQATKKRQYACIYDIIYKNILHKYTGEGCSRSVSHCSSL